MLRPIPVLFLALAAMQTTPAPSQTFEVASIKPNASNDNRMMIGIQPGGRFRASGVTVKILIGEAYDVRPFQIADAPGWASSERYDINAKAEGGGEQIERDALRAMLRALLEERFRLKIHKESKEMPVYALVVARSGSKLKPSATEGTARPMMRMGRGQLTCQNVPLSLLAQNLSQQLGRKVIDQTGLTGNFDFELEFTPEPGHNPFGGPPSPDAIPQSAASGPSIFTAVQEQLGLKLESQKGPVDIIVIDNIEKPTEN